MSTNLTDNFLYKGKKPLDDRQLFKTKADMKAFPESALPTLYDAFCEEDGNKYVFNKANEINEETGKWRIFEGGSDSSVDLSKYQKIKDDTLTTTDKTITGAINELKEEVGNNPVHYLGEGRYVGGNGDNVIKTGSLGDLYFCYSNKYNIIAGQMQSDKTTFDFSKWITSYVIDISWIEDIQILFNKEGSSAGTYTIGYFTDYPNFGDTVFKSEDIDITPGEWMTLKNPDHTKCKYAVIKHDTPHGNTLTIESIKNIVGIAPSPHLYVYTEHGWMSTNNFESSNYYSKTEVEELIDDATSISNSKFLTEDIEVKGIIDGLGYKNGDIISKDITANDFIKTLMRRVIPPTYIKPTYKVTITPSIVEVGKETTFNCVGTFTQNDAGTATTLIVKNYKDTEAYNGEYKNSISLTETIPTAGKYNHTFTINYNEGAVKQNNFGEDDETGKITAGSINITKQIEAVYPYYIGVSDTDILDEAKVTALTKKIETKNNKTIDFTTSQSHMVFAYPKEYGSIKSIIDANGFNVTDSFTITTLSINSIDYYIYVSNKCSDKYTMNFNY